MCIMVCNAERTRLPFNLVPDPVPKPASPCLLNVTAVLCYVHQLIIRPPPPTPNVQSRKSHHGIVVHIKRLYLQPLISKVLVQLLPPQPSELANLPSMSFSSSTNQSAESYLSIPSDVSVVSITVSRKYSNQIYA